MSAVKKRKVAEGEVEIYANDKTIEFYATGYSGNQSMVVITQRQWQEINEFVTKQREESK